MTMTVTRLPDGGVRYESDKAVVTIYEQGRYIRNGKFTEEGMKVLQREASRIFASRTSSKTQ